MSLSPELLEDAASTVFHVRVSVIMGVVGYTAMMYDHALTFADEVQYIWKTEKNAVVYMFLLNRYITPIVLAIDLFDKGGISSHISQEFCRTWYFVEAVWYMVSFGITHALVALRVIAVWGRPRWIVILLTFLWLSYFTVTCTLLFIALVSKIDTVRYEPSIRICYLSISPHLWFCWVPPLIFEAILFALSYIKTYRVRSYAADTPIIYVLFRDGALHFMVIVFCSMLNMITWRVAPPTLLALGKYFGLAIVNVMISRLVLNLRSCHRRSSEEVIVHRRAQFQVINGIEMSPSRKYFVEV